MQRVYPVIKSENRTGGVFSLPKEIKIYVSENLAFTADLYMQLFLQFTVGTSRAVFEVSKDLAENTIVVCDKSLAQTYRLKDKLSYAVEVTKNGAVLKGADFPGIANAFMTFLQLIRTRGEKVAETAVLPLGSFEDAPDIKFRGVHFCLFPGVSLDFLQGFIRLSAMYCYTHIIIEFWGTLKYDTLNALGWQDAFDKKQIKPILDEARMLGLEIIPFFNHLGHASQSRAARGEHVVLNQRPELEVLFEPDGWTWCLSNPESLRILKSVREELIELCGAGSYFHIGMDEAYSFGSCEKCAAINAEKMLANYINEVTAELKSLGRKSIIWGDMLLNGEDFSPSKYYANHHSKLNSKKTVKLLTRDTVIADWQYNIEKADDKSAAFFSSEGFELMMCPWFEEKNIIANIDIARRHNAGILITTWHETNSFITQLLNAAELMASGSTTGIIPYRTLTVAFLRKLLPTSDRKKAGFKGINQNIYEIMEMDI